MSLETKLIIFDIGGVVVKETGADISKTIAHQLGITAQELKYFSEEPLQRATSGLITLLNVYEEITKKIQTTKTPLELLKLHLKLYKQTCSQINQEVLGLVEQLKQNYIVACLTNTEPEIGEYNRKRNLFKPFEPYDFLSTEIKLRKPQPEAYQKVLTKVSERHGSEIKPHQAILTDDKLEYATAAEKLGIPSILYQNPNQLKKDLKEVRINF